jgi:uncharacterized protein (DUF305 family)
VSVDEREIIPETTTRRAHVMPGWGLTVVVALLSAALAATLTFIVMTARVAAPSDDSPEAGFARDMQVHHAQAVEMATIIRDRTTDTTIRSIAYDILTGQQQQMGQMFAWLRSWRLPPTGTAAPMSWMKPMDHTGMNGMAGMQDARSMSLQPDGRMPGMASPGQLARLRSLKDRPAETLFLRLMITHHRAGVMMAKAALDHADDPQVRDLARTIVKSQTVEIRAMGQLLGERGAVATR